MSYVKDSIYHTSLPIKVVDEKKLLTKYPCLGSGEEGSVFKYDEKTAIKVFEFFEKREKLTNKFAKIEELARIKDKNFCFPKGLVGYLNLKKEGYYMDLINPNPSCYDFSRLDGLKDMKKVLEYIMIADKAIGRIHKSGITLGDIRDDHILIDKSGEVRFVDTDNYAFLDYDYDLIPGRRNWFKRTYDKETSRIDNDIFVYTIVALQHLVTGSIVRLHMSDEYFVKVINALDVSQEVKDGLRLILSDAENKPHLNKVLKRVNPDIELTKRLDISSTYFR